MNDPCETCKRETCIRVESKPFSLFDRPINRCKDHEKFQRKLFRIFISQLKEACNQKVITC